MKKLFEILRISVTIFFLINLTVKAENMKEINSFALLPQEHASIQIAIVEFQKQNPSLDGYLISYKRENDRILISFTDKNSKEGLGSASNKLGFDVHLKMHKNGFTLISSSFSR